MLDVTGDAAEAETSDAGSRADGVEDEEVVDAETADEREGAAEGAEKGVGIEDADDADVVDCTVLLPKPLI